MRTSLFFFLITIFCSTFTFESQTQSIRKNVKFRHLEANPKLSNQDITDIFQSTNGFLWVGTVDGLNRFDGYDFKAYRHIENDTASLVSNIIQSIFEDSRGILWVSTLNSGLHCYEPSRDVFYRIPEFSYNDSQVLRIIEDIDHHVWIGGILDKQAFVAMWDHTERKWIIYPLFPAIEGIFSMLQHDKNEFWLGSRADGLFKWNKLTNELQQYLHDPNNDNSLPGNFIEAITKDPNGNLLIGTHDNGLSKFNLTTNQFSNFHFKSDAPQTTISSNAILDLCIDNNYLWIATEHGGLSRMDMRDETFTNYLYEKGNPNTIINNSIWSLHKDHQGRIWVGSYANGLCLIDNLEDKFQSMDPPMTEELVNVIFKDSKGRTWIGTEDGITLINGSSSQHFQKEYDNSNCLGSNAILCIYEDTKHRIWIGTWSGGLNLFHEDTKQFTRYMYDSNQSESLSNSHVFAILESSVTGELLVGTFGGLNILKDIRTGRFIHPFKYSVKEDGMIYSILEDQQHQIWVGSRSGASIYSLKDYKIARQYLTSDPSMIQDRVNCIHEDSMGTIWIGSSGGLHQKTLTNEFITYTINDGLPVNVVQGILEDGHGNLWLGTTKGLSYFDLSNKSFKTYDKSDGLLTLEFRRKAFFKDADNGLFYVGGKGINTFYPDSIISNPNLPNVYITELKIFNHSVTPNTEDGILTHDIMVTKEIDLDYRHYFFSLHFVGINLTASYKNKYAYQLEGFDQDWVYVGTQRFATYTNLDPGDYVFRVKASNNDDIWNNEGTSLVIHILPPWWETWWAYLLFFVLIIISIYSIVRIRTSYLSKQKKLLKMMVMDSTIELKVKNERIAMQAEELQAFNDSLNALNENLEKTVEERTHELTIKNNKLADYAFINAHNLRVPVANIKGIIQLFKGKKSIDEVFELIEMLQGQSENLDNVLKEIQKMLESDNLIRKQEIDEKK